MSSVSRLLVGYVEEHEWLLHRSDGFYATALLQAESEVYELAVFSLKQHIKISQSLENLIRFTLSNLNV